MVQGVSSEFRPDGFISKSESPKYNELLLQHGISPDDVIGPGGRIKSDINPAVIDDLYALRDDLFSKVGDPLFPDIEYDIQIFNALMKDISLNSSKSPEIKKLQEVWGRGLPSDIKELFTCLNKDIQTNPKKWIEFLSKPQNRELLVNALKPYLTNPKYEKEAGVLLCNLLTLPDSKGKLMETARRLFSVISNNKAQSGRVLQFVKNPAAIVLLAGLANIGPMDLMARLGLSAKPDEIDDFDKVARSVQSFGDVLSGISFGNLSGSGKVEHFLSVCKLYAEYYAETINDDQLEQGMADIHFVEDGTGEYDWIHMDIVPDEDKTKSLKEINSYGDSIKYVKESNITNLMDKLSSNIIKRLEEEASMNVPTENKPEIKTISLNISNKTLQQGNSGVDQGEIDEEPEEGITEETTGDGEPMEEPGEEIQEADPKIDK